MDLLYEDADLLVVDKPAGLLTVPGRGHPECVLTELSRQLARRDGGDPPRILPVHRLDREASGVLLLARHTDAQRYLSEQFLQRQTRKWYWALLAGVPEPSEGRIDLPLEADPERPQTMRVRRKPTTRTAVTDYTVLERFDALSLVEARPLTGRTHQIRVHFAATGRPLAVDAIYGSARGVMLSDFKSGYRLGRFQEERPLIARLTLHALRLGFRRPSDQAELSIEAPLPKDFRATLQALRRWVGEHKVGEHKVRDGRVRDGRVRDGRVRDGRVREHKVGDGKIREHQPSSPSAAAAAPQRPTATP